MKKSKTIKDCRALLEHYGVATPAQLGRAFYRYTDCGPATTFHLKNGEDLYYGDRKASSPAIIDQITGIHISSIVEGSDAEIEGESLLFPFTMQELNDLIKGVNDEAGFYWRRDNTDNFVVVEESTGSRTYVAWTQFEDKPEWSDRLPLKVRRAWVKWYTEGRWNNGMATIVYDKPIDFGLPGWHTIQWLNDCTY